MVLALPAVKLKAEVTPGAHFIVSHPGLNRAAAGAHGRVKHRVMLGGLTAATGEGAQQHLR